MTPKPQCTKSECRNRRYHQTRPRLKYAQVIRKLGIPDGRVAREFYKTVRHMRYGAQES